MTQGAVRAPQRSPATKVWVFQWPKGALERRRSPLSQRPRARVIFVLVPVSSMKTSRCGSVPILNHRAVPLNPPGFLFGWGFYSLPFGGDFVMPKPYSIDLRERVVSYVEAGHSRRGAAAHFSVSASFVVNFIRAFGERGGVAPKALGGWRHSKLDPHRVFILRRVAEKDDITMPELAAELLAASGVKADPASLSHWLIRNGLSFKKKPSGQRMRSARRAPGARGVEG